MPFFYNDKGYISVNSNTLDYDDIKEVEIMIIHKDSIRNYARKYNIDEVSAITKSKEMREKQTFKISLGKNNTYPNLHYSIALDEQPVNLVISTNDLKNMAIFHKTIIELSSEVNNSETDTNVVSSSIKYSCELFNNGQTVKEISQDRELTYSTIINHLYKGALDGLVDPIPSFLTKDVRVSIHQAIQQHGEENLSSIKRYLDEKLGTDEVSYTSIKQYFIEVYSNR